MDVDVPMILRGEYTVLFNIMSLFFPALGGLLKWRLLDPIGGMVLSAYIIFEWIKTLYENFQNRECATSVSFLSYRSRS